MSEQQITLEQFTKLVKEHDFYYVMTEDKRAYTKGLEEELRIKALCLDNKEFKKIYETQRKKRFNERKPEK